MKTKLIIYLIPFLVLVLLFNACLESEKTPIRIAFSKGTPKASYLHYYQWLQQADSGIECVDMYSLPIDSALNCMETCSGLLLTGGPDLYPGMYGKESDTIKCSDGFDIKRDTLELALIAKAHELGIPVFGICRGLQVINVYFGGSLYTDLPSDIMPKVTHRCFNKDSCFHSVNLNLGTQIAWASGIMTGRVNSNHHQGIEMLAKTLKAGCTTVDGLIESVEWNSPMDKPFLMAVQWHPEKMEFENPLSGTLAHYYIEAAKVFNNEKEMNRDH